MFVYSFVLFPPTPLIVFLVAMKKCAMPLSEPLVDHRPKSEMDRRSWCVGGPRGVSSHTDDMENTTGTNLEEICYSLINYGLVPIKENMRQGNRGTVELLYRATHPHAPPPSWILNYHRIYKIRNEVLKFIEKTMETWRVELRAGGTSLAEVKVQRGIFLVNVLSPLLFVIPMMPDTNSANRKKR